jgi:uncharacterized alpha-E superfamily protein
VHCSIKQVAKSLKGLRSVNRTQYMLLRETEYFLDDLRGGAALEQMQTTNLKDFLDSIQQRCDVIADMINQSFFNSVTVTLTDAERNMISVQIPQQQQVKI